MSQLSQASVASSDGFDELQRECEDYAAVTRAETETRLRLVNEMKPLLELLKRPVTLNLRMSGLFPEAVKLTVGSDFSLKATHIHGKASSVPLLSLEDAFVAVVKEVTARIDAEVAARHRRELARTRPKLRAELRVEKKRIPIFGRWRYQLVVFNLGGDALSVALTTKCGSKESLIGGIEIPGGDSVNCELKDYKGGSLPDNLNVDVAYSDSRLTQYLGTVRLPQGGGYGSIRLKEPPIRRDASGED